MHSIYAITTHHERPDEAAEWWKSDGVCAIGWSDTGPLTRLSKDERNGSQNLFMEIKRGDMILAYALGNRISSVGEVIGPYRYNTRNTGTNLESLERGLRIVSVEDPLNDSDRPDFIAEDRRGTEVIIECKGTATPDALNQLERYGNSNRKARLMLVAYRLDAETRRIAARNHRFELYECDLRFKSV